MNKIIKIEARYCGPPGIGNGGYVSGMLAGFLPGAVEVTLKKPAPLDQELEITDAGEGMVSLNSDEGTVAEAKVTEFDIEVPVSPSLLEAEEASGRYPGFNAHPCPGCFVCGPDRRSDGLRIYPGRLPETRVVATPWTPGKSLADSEGNVKPEFIWAVLDCPGAVAAAGGELLPILLGRMALKTISNVEAGKDYIVIGWLISSEGRKYHTGTALYSSGGKLKACARATWIRPKDTGIVG